MPTTTYPQYRKYANNKVYFKILSEKEWEEVHYSLKKYTLDRFTAAILPDRNYLYDLTFDYENNWVKIDEEEYNNVKIKCANQ
jgi:hypothetical protein